MPPIFYNSGESYIVVWVFVILSLPLAMVMAVQWQKQRRDGQIALLSVAAGTPAVSVVPRSPDRSAMRAAGSAISLAISPRTDEEAGRSGGARASKRARRVSFQSDFVHTDEKVEQAQSPTQSVRL